LLRDGTAPVFSYQTWFRIGARDEEEGATGIAHFFEHLMFKGTKNVDGHEFNRRIEEAGCPDLNAWTAWDETVYLQSLPKERFPMIADLESDRMANLILNDEQVSSEREVVLNERKFRVDNDPYGKLSEELWSRAFTRHPYHHPVIGWEADIRGLTLKKCLEFYRRGYSPRNALLVLVGDLDTEATLRVLAERYGPLAARPSPRRRRWSEPEQRELRQWTMELPTETDILTLGIKVPPAGDRDHVAIRVLTRLLGGGRTSRLYRRLVDGGIAGSVGSQVFPLLDQGLAEITVTLRPGRSAAEAESIVLEEIVALGRRGVSEAEFRQTLAVLRSDLYRGLKETSGKAELLGIGACAAEDYLWGIHELTRLDELRREDAERVASRIFRLEGVTSLCGVPEGRPSASPRAPEPATLELPGPSKLLLEPDRSLPLVSFRLVFPFGSDHDPAGREGLARMTAEMLLRGTRRRAKEEFLAEVEGAGGHLGVLVERERTSVSGEVLAQNFPRMLTLVAEALTEPAFPGMEFDRLRVKTLADLAERRNDDRTLAHEFFRRGLFADHPYGRSPLGSEAGIRAIALRDVEAFYRAHWSPERAVVGVAGAFETEPSREALTRLLGELPARSSPALPWVEPRPVQGRRVVLVDKPDRTQAQIYLGHRGLRVIDRDYPSFAVASTAFGGPVFSATLFQEVREKRGWSYGAYASLGRARHADAFQIWVFPSLKDTAPAVGLCLELLEHLHREGVTESQLEFARSYILNTDAFARNTAEKRLALRIEKELTGYDREAFLEGVRATTLAGAKAAVERRIDPANLVISVLCTAEAVRSAFEALPGITSVEVVPYDAL
jgi:zinc protease